MCKEHVPTPGPWRAYKDRVYGKARSGREEWLASCDSPYVQDAAANARLIAAAPDLLSLLTEARARLGGIYDPQDDALYDLRDRIDAALARATPTTSLKGE